MSLSAIVVLLLVGAASVLFITEWLRADLVALLLLVVLGATGILSPQETLSGFSRSAVITILAIFILTAGLTRTGASRALGVRLLRWAGQSESTLLVVLMSVAAFLSLFMNNIAAASVLLPVAVGVSRARQISPSKLMMPLSFATLLGGMATLLTTSNILVSAALRDANYPDLGLLDFAPIGVPALVVGIVYMLVVGRRLLPRRAPADWERMLTASRASLTDVYGIHERWVQARVAVGSPLEGRTLSDAGFGRELGVNVIAVVHGGKARLAPPPSERLRVGSDVYLQAREEQIDALRMRGLDILPTLPAMDSLTSDAIGLFEIVVPPRSQAGGKTLREIHFREKFGLSVLAIWTEGRPRRVGLGDMNLQPGQTLLVLGPRAQARLLQGERDFLVLMDTAEEGLRTHRLPHALAIMAISIALAGTGVLPTAEAMLAGALAMVLVGALTMDEAYQSVEWKSIFLIAGMLPVGLALNNTGASTVVGQWIVQALGAYGSPAVLSGLLVLTIVLTQFMGGQATAVILAPIAIHAALSLNANPRPFALAVAYGCSLAFLTPLAHPANILVMGPGGYKFADYFRVGILLTVLLGALIIGLLVFGWGG
jgi:di/tricarboxylate transporter